MREITSTLTKLMKKKKKSKRKIKLRFGLENIKIIFLFANMANLRFYCVPEWNTDICQERWDKEKRVEKC